MGRRSAASIVELWRGHIDRVDRSTRLYRASSLPKRAGALVNPCTKLAEVRYGLRAASNGGIQVDIEEYRQNARRGIIRITPAWNDPLLPFSPG